MRQYGADNEHPASEERGQPAALFLGELPGHQTISLDDRVNGVPMTEHHHLITTVLKDEWASEAYS
jgi:hypothetical protein